MPAINVSSPNTAQLRELQHVDRLAPILDSLLEAREQCLRRFARRPPLLLKISPDQSEQQLVAVLRLLRTLAFDGVIAANTTVTRPAAVSNVQQRGGLSGAPLLPLAQTTVCIVRQELGPRAAIIGAGGMGSAADAHSMLAAGADLVQIYTGLVYCGPALIRELRRALQSRGSP